jgi:hypothetical protein
MGAIRVLARGPACEWGVVDRGVIAGVQDPRVGLRVCKPRSEGSWSRRPPLPSRRCGTYVVEERAHVGRDQQHSGARGGHLPRHRARAARALGWAAAAASCGPGRAGVSRGRGASAAPGGGPGEHRGLGGSGRAWPGLRPRARSLFAAPRPRARSPPRLTAARAQPLDPPGKFPAAAAAADSGSDKSRPSRGRGLRGRGLRAVLGPEPRGRPGRHWIGRSGGRRRGLRGGARPRSGRAG